MKISIITTAYNEEKSVLPFYNSLEKSLKGKYCELIFVNDGSEDKTLEEIKKIKDKKLKVINQKHKGKDAALYQALEKAQGDIIATIDADLQDEPKDIIKLLKKMEEGWDFVCGWRYKRQDKILRRISSKIGNLTLKLFFGVDLHDSNCPVKVFKKECLEGIRFFDHFHRFLTVLAKIRGYKICEKRVENYQRKYGKSKYGVRNRVFGNFRTILFIKLNGKKLVGNKNPGFRS